MSHFELDYRGVGELLRSQMVEDALLVRGERVKAQAEATAPYRPGSETHFRDSFHVESTREGGAHHDRVAVSVYNDDDAALSIETGTSDTPAHHTLTKALDAAGGDV